MDRHISAVEANRSFSRLLRKVREGHSITITFHGRPVARIVPCDAASRAQEAARAALLARLSAQPGIDIGPWQRDELYERCRRRGDGDAD